MQVSNTLAALHLSSPSSSNSITIPNAYLFNSSPGLALSLFGQSVVPNVTSLCQEITPRPTHFQPGSPERLPSVIINPAPPIPSHLPPLMQRLTDDFKLSRANAIRILAPLVGQAVSQTLKQWLPTPWLSSCIIEMQIDSEMINIQLPTWSNGLSTEPVSTVTTSAVNGSGGATNIPKTVGLVNDTAAPAVPAVPPSSRRKRTHPHRISSCTSPLVDSQPNFRSQSGPTSPSADSGALDLSRGASSQSSTPVTPVKPLNLTATSNDHLEYNRCSHSADCSSLNQPTSAGSSPEESGPVGVKRQAEPVVKRRRIRQSYIRRSSGQNRLFSCNQCRQQFSSLHRLEQHTLALHGSYRCHICHNRFTQRSNLQRHALKHVGFKPFECALCGKAYNRKDHLMRHMEVAHPEVAPLDHIKVHLTSSQSLGFLDDEVIRQPQVIPYRGDECPVDAGPLDVSPDQLQYPGSEGVRKNGTIIAKKSENNQ